MAYHYNLHTLYVLSDVAVNSQLNEVVSKAIRQAEVELGRSFPCVFRSNLVFGKDGEPLGVGYLWVTNPAVYYMLLDKNPDGSERVEYRDDPNWVAPVTNVNSLSTSWADITDAEEKNTAPKIKVQLPPLITLSKFTYTEKQKEQVRARMIKQMMKEGNYNPEAEIKVPECGSFTISAAFVTDLDEKYLANVLCTRNVPKWVTEQDLKRLFKPYAKDSESMVERRNRGKDSYPFVVINRNGMAFITYDHRGHDAQFALYMTRKVDLKKDNNHVTLIFNHALQRD